MRPAEVERGRRNLLRRMEEFESTWQLFTKALRRGWRRPKAVGALAADGGRLSCKWMGFGPTKGTFTFCTRAQMKIRALRIRRKFIGRIQVLSIMLKMQAMILFDSFSVWRRFKNLQSLKPTHLNLLLCCPQSKLRQLKRKHLEWVFRGILYSGHPWLTVWQRYNFSIFNN